MHRSLTIILILSSTGCGPFLPRPALPETGFSLERKESIRSGAVLRVADCLRIAKHQNPQMIASRLLEWQARAGLRQNQSALLPVVKVAGRAARYSDPQRIAPTTTSVADSVSSEDLGTWDATLTWNLFAGGRDLWRIRSSADLLDATRADAEATEQAVTAWVISAYYLAVTKKAIADALAGSARALSAQARRQQELLEQDKSSLLEVTRIRVRAAEVLDQAKNEQAQAQLALMRLFHLLGQSAVPVELESVSPIRVTVPEEDRLVWKEILQRRPDLRAARLRQQAQQARVLTVQGEYWPSFSLVGSYGQRVDVTDWPVEDNHLRSAGYVGLDLSWTPFEGGRIHYLSQQENATLQVMIQNLRALELAAVLEIRTFLHQLRSARDRLRTAQEALELAKTSLELENQRMELGQTTFTDYQLVEAATLDAQVRVLQLLAEVQINWVQYRLATGALP